MFEKLTNTRCHFSLFNRCLQPAIPIIVFPTIPDCISLPYIDFFLDRFPDCVFDRFPFYYPTWFPTCSRPVPSSRPVSDPLHGPVLSRPDKKSWTPVQSRHVHQNAFRLRLPFPSGGKQWRTFFLYLRSGRPEKFSTCGFVNGFRLVPTSAFITARTIAYFGFPLRFCYVFRGFCGGACRFGAAPFDNLTPAARQAVCSTYTSWFRTHGLAREPPPLPAHSASLHTILTLVLVSCLSYLLRPCRNTRSHHVVLCCYYEDCGE